MPKLKGGKGRAAGSADASPQGPSPKLIAGLQNALQRLTAEDPQARVLACSDMGAALEASDVGPLLLAADGFGQLVAALHDPITAVRPEAAGCLHNLCLECGEAAVDRLLGSSVLEHLLPLIVEEAQALPVELRLKAHLPTGGNHHELALQQGFQLLTDLCEASEAVVVQACDVRILEAAHALLTCEHTMPSSLMAAATFFLTLTSDMEEDMDDHPLANMPQEIPMALDAIIKQPITEHEAPPAILARLAAIGATVNMGRLSSVVLPSALAVLVHALRAIEGPAWEATAEAIHARAKETPDDPQAIAHQRVETTCSRLRVQALALEILANLVMSELEAAQHLTLELLQNNLLNALALLVCPLTREQLEALRAVHPSGNQLQACIHSQDETWLGAIANLGFGGMLSDVTSDTLQLLSQGCFHIMHRWPWASMSATLLPTLWTVLRAVLSDEALACNLSFANEDLRNIIEAFSNGHLDWHTRISASGVLTALAQCSHHHDLLPELCGLYTVELATVSVERLEFLHAIFSGLCEAFADTRANELVASTGLMSVMHKCVEQLRAMERGASPEAAEGIEACCNLAQQFSELKSQQ